MHGRFRKIFNIRSVKCVQFGCLFFFVQWCLPFLCNTYPAGYNHRKRLDETLDCHQFVEPEDFTGAHIEASLRHHTCRLTHRHTQIVFILFSASILVKVRRTVFIWGLKSYFFKNTLSSVTRKFTCRQSSRQLKVNLYQSNFIKQSHYKSTSLSALGDSNIHFNHNKQVK